MVEQTGAGKLLIRKWYWMDLTRIRALLGKGTQGQRFSVSNNQIYVIFLFLFLFLSFLSFHSMYLFLFEFIYLFLCSFY